MDVVNRRKSSRLAVTKPVICHRYGRQRAMRTLDIGLGGLKLESNFDLGVGETINFAILTNGTRIRCKGRVLATEDLGNKVIVRLCFAPPSDWEYGKLSNYLHGLSAERKMPYLKWVIVGLYGLSAYLAYLFIRALLFK